MRGRWYQLSLIFLGLLVTALFGVFFIWELFPEYRIYQSAYIELEEFRSSYTAEPPPPFEGGVKQIILENQKGGPPTIDRCISCHVALQFNHFSPTKIARDINGNMILDKDGIPKKVPNEEYIFTKLDEKIASLEASGKDSEAERFKALLTAEVGEHIYDMKKVLKAHPLMGRETRPFEYHPIEQYGCTSCHNGNGHALTTDRAHGPVKDGTYEASFQGPKPVFLERDPANDPEFAYVFNDKPGHRLLFQTEPLFVGSLIQAKCMQCHRGSDTLVQDAARETAVAAERKAQQTEAIKQALENEKNALHSLLELKTSLINQGYRQTVDALRKKAVDFTLPTDKRKAFNQQLDFILRDETEENPAQKVLKEIDEKIIGMLGSSALLKKLTAEIDLKKPFSDQMAAFIRKNKEREDATGTLFVKAESVEKELASLYLVDVAEEVFTKTADDKNVLTAMKSTIDTLTENFQRGKSLYITQACYPCHRIAGFARGGVGPELTYSGESYPWFLKESIVWPQADLATSTMPNFHLDHEEVEDLMTFLLAQHGRGRAVSETSYNQAINEWEAGAKMPWEKPVEPVKLHDLRYSMTVFATEGCAACHRLKGFESNVGFKVEKKGDVDFPTLYKERLWFQNLIPENSAGSDIVSAIEKNQKEIDERIVDGVRKDGLLEDIEANNPGLIASFYSNFKFAERAKNAFFKKKLAELKDPVEKEKVQEQLKSWKSRVRRILLMYVQEYGLGRLIGPRPNWSGIYRSDEWLIEHFRKPTSHIARSIMPVMPFDDSKFYALTYMLDMLAKKNRDEVRQIWTAFGFEPKLAYQIHCSQCHGEYLHGNGPVAEWIYPIPKNLRNADFLRNYTRENIINSIIHGVDGTPMPPWGEVAKPKPFENNTPVLTKAEIAKLVDWLFSSLLGGTVIRGREDVPKWQYGPQDVMEELEKEGNQLESGPDPEFLELREIDPDLSLLALQEMDYIAGMNVIAQGSVKDIFDVAEDPADLEEKKYTIKSKFYTEKNIKEGQQFFFLNCTPCHGIEADGQGFRAGSMYDAKPRMLTNLHWIGSRDDLRLLRSIKYGVTGTAMTPWGDQTSTLQRLQLVIFIRSLSLEQKQREELFNTLYKTFDVASQTLDRARIKESTTIDALEEKREGAAAKRKQLIHQEGRASSDEIVALYKKELNLSLQLDKHRLADERLKELKDLLNQERSIYQRLGVSLIGKTIARNTFETYLEIIRLPQQRYKVQEGVLIADFNKMKSEKQKLLVKEIEENLKAEIAAKEKRQKILEAHLPSQQRNEALEETTSKLSSLKKVVQNFQSGIEEAARLERSQERIYREYKKKLQELEKNDNI